MRKKLLLLSIFIVAISLQDVNAQCAMCKAVAESGESGIVNGLNDGILYLMAAPYILMGSIGFAWYKFSKKRKTTQA